MCDSLIYMLSIASENMIFVLVCICRFPLPLDVWEGLRFVILALPGLFSYLFFIFKNFIVTAQYINLQIKC